MLSDLLLTLASGNHAILILLDLSAAFDIINHCILLGHLKHVAGIQGKALQWFNHIYNIDQSEYWSIFFSSSSAIVSCGVPKGSILDLKYFIFIIFPLGSEFRKYITYHCYADNMQLYWNREKHIIFRRLSWRFWMARNFLQLNM